MSKAPTFYEVVTAAVNDTAERGYDPVRVDIWMAQIAAAAQRDMVPEAKVAATLQASLGGLYRRYVDQGALLRQNPGVGRFTIEKVKPQLRAELERRIAASAQLIRLNRTAAIQKTLQRFSGWASSIPAGGSNVVDKRDTKADIKKSLKQLPFEERRVLIDQGHKFVAALSETLATSSNAIAGVWHSHWRQENYNYRRDHKARSGKVFAVRDNWALEKGLMKVGPAGYTDDVTRPGEEPYCRCSYTWLFNLRDLPEDMVTAKCREAMAAARIAA